MAAALRALPFGVDLQKLPPWMVRTGEMHQVPAPLIACSTCGTLFCFANAPLLPLYSQVRSGQTTDPAMG
jgi:hypothetical protein